MRSFAGSGKLKILTLLLALCALGMPVAWGQTKHWNVGKNDRLAECVGQTLKYKVLITVGLPSLNPSVCEAGSPEGLRTRLASAGLGLVTSDKWAWIVPASTVSQVTGSTGKNLQLVIETNIRADNLSKEEQDALLDALTGQARFVPISAYPYRQQADGSWQVLIALNYQVQPLAASPTGAARMAVLERQSNEAGYNRVIFVEEEDHKFEIKWDSGELDAENVGLEFDDLLGDGKQEIVAMGEVAVDVGEPNLDVLAAFDADGNELTRQDPCPGNGYGRAEQMVCPIQGGSVSFLTNGHPWEIEVVDTVGEDKRERTTHFNFVKETRHYAAVPTPKPKPKPDQ